MKVFTRLVLAVFLSALVGCAPPAPEREADTSAPTPPPAPATPERKADAPPAPAREIYIDSIVAGNPLTVTGRARTFENTVSLRVRDIRGDVIAEDFVTSAGEMGHHNPFAAEVWIVRDPGGRVTIEAFEYSAKDGSVQSLVSKTAAYDVETISATLMFPRGDCAAIAPFTRRLPKSIALARLLTEGLVIGPTPQERAAGATPPFPQGSDVRSVVLRDGHMTVDFNERLQNVGGSCAALAIRESVTRTLQQLPGVKEVTITAGGSKELALQP